MKNISKIFLAIFMITVLLVNCKKDDDDDDDNGNSSKNYFKVGDVEYSLSDGVLENYGQDEEIDDWNYEGYNLDLALVSSGISIGSDNEGNAEATGSGQVMYFEIFTSNSTGLDSRDYSFDDSEGTYEIGTFDYADYCLDYSFNSETCEWVEIDAGKITVSKSGNIYEITINCTDENDESITGYYKGSLKYFNYDEGRKSVSIKTRKR